MWSTLIVGLSRAIFDLKELTCAPLKIDPLKQVCPQMRSITFNNQGKAACSAKLEEELFIYCAAFDVEIRGGGKHAVSS